MVGTHRQALSAEDLQTDILWFVASFSLNTCVTCTPSQQAVGGISPEQLQGGRLLLFASLIVSSAFVSAHVVDFFGSRTSILVGMAVSTAYAGLFAIAAVAAEEQRIHILKIAYIFGGQAVGLLWPAHGDYIAQMVSATCAKTGRKRDEVSANLTGLLAFSVLLAEVSARLLWHALLSTIAPSSVSCCCALVGAIAMFLMTRTHDVSRPRKRHDTGWRAMFPVISMWQDPVTALMSGMNVLFGATMFIVNTYVNREIILPRYGHFKLPALVAFAGLTAAMASIVFGKLAAHIGKLLVVMIGCVAHIAVWVLISFTSLGTASLVGSLYALYGISRASYESVNKGALYDVFPESTHLAFSNAILEVAVSFIVWSLLYDGGILSLQSISYIICFLAMMTSPRSKRWTRRRRRRRRKRRRRR
eukprot:TRINITY_DN25310_c0_g1_i2.p1 TRINITY_DN25310_c0_g1~~TRINITY_DN25310_c0_g1_i2.p1  ORF type:complete len:439 (-),score=14.18 TRINITY_DN25310_c0_g1_i2:79-1332(-)